MDFLRGGEEKIAMKWMNEAAAVATRALCLCAKCGSVIVKNGKVIGRGYNSPPLDKVENRMCNVEIGTGKPKYDRTCCIHAEWRAIIDALKNFPKDVSGSQLYFTRIDENEAIKKSGQPYCTVCSRLALDTGIATFALWHEQGISEYTTQHYNQLSYMYAHPTD